MFCPHCGKPNKEDGKFCVHCGKPLSLSSKATPQTSTASKAAAVAPKVATPEKIEKWKKNVKLAGESARAFGWIEIAIYSALFIWYVVDKNFSQSGLAGKVDAGGMVAVLYAGFIYIVLGDRLRKLKDKNAQRYLTIVIVLTIAMGGLSLISGGGLGLIFLLLVLNLFRGLDIGKLSKTVDFQSGLVDQKYRVTKLWWIVITIIAVVAFFAASLYVPARSQETSNTNQVSNQQTSQAWITYTSDKGDFTASLPLQPQRTSDSSPITNTSITIETNGYESTLANGESYFINVNKYIGATSVDTQKMLEGALNGMVSSSADNHLVSSSNTKVGGYSATDYLVQNGTTYLKGRLIVRDATLYQLMYQYEGSQYVESNYNDFISKFTLI